MDLRMNVANIDLANNHSFGGFAAEAKLVRNVLGNHLAANISLRYPTGTEGPGWLSGLSTSTTLFASATGQWCSQASSTASNRLKQQGVPLGKDLATRHADLIVVAISERGRPEREVRAEAETSAATKRPPRPTVQPQLQLSVIMSTNPTFTFDIDQRERRDRRDSSAAITGYCYSRMFMS